MTRRKDHSTVKFSISMEKILDEDIKLLAKDVGLTKSQVIADIIDFVMSDEDLLNELYPLESEEEEEAGEREEEEE